MVVTMLVRMAVMVVMMVMAAAAMVVIVTVVMMFMPAMLLSVMVMSMMVMSMMFMAPCRDMLRIGAAFGIEGRLDLRRLGAETARHVLDHVIATDAQLRAEDLRRQVAIAEMPGDAHEMFLVARGNLEQRLRRRQDLDQPAVFERERVAGTQHDGFRQVEQEFEAPDALHDDAAAMPIVEIEHDRVGRIATPGAGRLHLRCAKAHRSHLAHMFAQNSRAPSGTGKSGENKTTSPSASGKPSVNTSDMNLPIWRGGKLTTAATFLPTSLSAV